MTLASRDDETQSFQIRKASVAKRQIKGPEKRFVRLCYRAMDKMASSRLGV